MCIRDRAELGFRIALAQLHTEMMGAFAAEVVDGVAPGSASGGTSYILGHSWARAPLVLNQLSELATTEYPGAGPQNEGGVPIYPVVGLNGYAITLTTPTGTLVYDVTRSYLVSKNLAGNVDSLMANSPDRVVIITCAVQNGIDLDYNVIVEATLASSAAAAV